MCFQARQSTAKPPVRSPGRGEKTVNGPQINRERSLILQLFDQPENLIEESYHANDTARHGQPWRRIEPSVQQQSADDPDQHGASQLDAER